MFRVTVKDESQGEWNEDYPNVGRNWEVENQADAEIAGKSFIEEFNRTLRPGEKPREFVKAEYLGNDPVAEAQYKDEDGDAI